LPLATATAHYVNWKMKATQEAILFTSSPYKTHLKLAKEKQNTKELNNR
jgi:hypothetical protein